MYAVLAYRSDCGDDCVFTIEDLRGHNMWEDFFSARMAMVHDYEDMREEYSPDWSRSGRDLRKSRLLKASAEFSVPIWDGERECESELKCKWKVVRI